MAVEIMEIGIKLRKILVFTIKSCYRLALNHPFVVGMLSFFIYLYRSSPFMFSLLLSASPVLICTAILLGILLSYGEESNLPEIEEEIKEKTTRENVLVKKSEEVPLDSSVVERNESFYVERYSNNEVDLTDQLTFSENKIDDEVHDEDFADDTTPLIEERSRRIELNHEEEWERNGRLENSRNKQKIESSVDVVSDREITEHHHFVDDTAPLIEERSRRFELNHDEEWERDGRVEDLRNKQKIESSEDVISDREITEHHHYAPIPDMDDEHIRLDDDDDDNSETESFDSEKVNVDSLDSPPHSPWSRVEEPEAEFEREYEDDVIDSESDGSESSSPDASMADIRPMLDELHPLLNEGASQTVPLPRIQESDNELEDEEDENEDEEDEDEEEEEEEDDDAKVDIEEETKSAITWTEEDQKNLMDLGSSEIERNLRLEHLIMRRRSRRNMVTERNLIDLEGFDLPFTIPPIATRRQNPFDTPEDSYNNSGLPPIPGSAPSVLLPRRNPFDLPYDSSEEKPDLKGDGFQDEFKPLQTRESLFRRYESFKVGPSSLAPERQDIRMRPYFVPERTFSEESIYSPFQRQSSGLSESKVSSVPETESLGSVDDLEERKISEEEDNLKEPEVTIPQIEEIGEESSLVEPHQLIISDAEDAREEDVITTHEPALISNLEDDYEIGHGSQSPSSSSSSESESEEEDHQEPCQVEQNDALGRELETQLGNISGLDQEENIPQSVEFQSIPSENVVQRYSRGSSSSSLSEESERIYTEPEPEGCFILDEERDVVTHQERDIATHNSIESTTHLGISSNTSVPDNLQREQPVYDLSPREVGTNLASSSISSDVHETIGIHQANEFESVSTDAVNMGEHENATANFSEANLISDNEGSLTAFLGKNLVEHELDQLPSTSVDINAHDLVESSEYQTHTLLQDEEYVLVSENDVQNHDKEIQSDGRLISENFVGKDDISLSPNSDSNHLHEVHESETTLDSSDVVRTVNEQYMPEIQELDPDSISLKEASSLDLGSISFPPNESETTTAHVDMPKTVEEADEIREINEALLSELDFVGDFSNKDWVSGRNEFEKPVDFVTESMSSTHHADLSTMRVVEVNLVEENKIDHIMSSDDLKEDTDMKENTGEPQNVDRNIIEHIDMKENEISTDENEVHNVVHSMVSHDNEDISGVLEVKEQTEEITKYMEKDESRSALSEDMVGKEASYQVEAHISSNYEHHGIDTSMLENNDLTFNQISGEEMMEPINLDSREESNVVTKESVTEQSESEETSHKASSLELGSVEDQSIGSPRVAHSADEIQHPIESGGTQRTKELHLVEHVSSESTHSPPELVMEVKAGDNMQPNIDDGSLQVQEDEVRFATEEFSVQDINETAIKDLHSITSGNNDHIQNVEKHGEAGETLSESNETEDIPFELNMLANKEVLDHSTEEKLDEAKAHKIGSSLVTVEVSSIEEIIVKPGHGVDENEGIHHSSSSGGEV